MKALHLIKTPVGATWAVRQIEELQRLSVDVEVAIPEGPRAEDLRSLGIPVHTVNVDIAARNPAVVRHRIAALRDLVRSRRPDIVHSHFVGTTLAMRIALRGDRTTKRIFQVPGPLHLERRHTAWVELSPSQPVDTWIATCRWTYDRYLDLGIAPDRVALSYYGRDIHIAPAHPPGHLRSITGLTTGEPIIGMVAYMYPPKRYLGQRTGLKGHEDLIRAAGILIDEGSPIHVVFIGGAWNDATAYEERVRRLGSKRLGDRAVFLGTRDDVDSLYPDMAVAVHPSHSENVGGAVESLLAGVPTVATAVGGLPDLVRDGTTGLLVPPRDPRSLAEAVSKMLMDPERAQVMAADGQRLAAELFDIRTTAAQVAAWYDATLTG